jgi:hypothetical protein
MQQLLMLAEASLGFQKAAAQGFGKTGRDRCSSFRCLQKLPWASRRLRRKDSENLVENSANKPN